MRIANVWVIVVLLAGCRTRPDNRPNEQNDILHRTVQLSTADRWADALAEFDAVAPSHLPPTLTSFRHLLVQQDARQCRATFNVLDKSSAAFAFDAIPLGLCFDYLSNITGITFVVDWHALESQGLVPDSHVSFQAKSQSVRRSLEALLEHLSGELRNGMLGYRAENGGVLVSIQDEDQLWSDAQHARVVLLTTNIFESRFTGFGAPSSYWQAMEQLSKHHRAEEIFRELIAFATPAGQLYGLMGLQERDPDAAKELSAAFQGSDEKVKYYDGCLASMTAIGRLIEEYVAP